MAQLRWGDPEPRPTSLSADKCSLLQLGSLLELPEFIHIILCMMNVRTWKLNEVYFEPYEIFGGQYLIRR
jgi:hypothetical protein